MIYPKVLYCYPEMAGSLFLPSNGTEGMMFTEEFCDCCINQHPDPDNPRQCDILCMTMADGKQPEWIFNYDGWPICKEWKKWDWGNDDDGYNEPPEPEPDDPNQLMIPFDIMDYFGFDDSEICVTRQAIFEKELVN
jgi:hypothetical protein